MKAICALSLCLILLACGDSNERDMADCCVDVLRVRPNDERPASDSLDEHFKACMRAKGYHFSAVSPVCRNGDLYQDAGCYVR